MENRYMTVKDRGIAEIVEKRSRFIATVIPIENEAQALEFLDSTRRKYWDATHNVYAYITRENNIERYSDDGEPSGTAGVPVLDMLKKEGLTNIAVVVTRYFGGTLLGTGGLVHAYSKSAKAGVEAAGRLEMILCDELNIECDYPLLGKIQNELHKWETIDGYTDYSDKVKLSLYTPCEDTDRIVAGLIDATNSNIKTSIGIRDYFPKPV